jgi:hypothetical protein
MTGRAIITIDSDDAKNRAQKICEQCGGRHLP